MNKLELEQKIREYKEKLDKIQELKCDLYDIENSIIDGSQPLNTDSASVVTISECGIGTELCGFTITGGYGIKTPWNARGGGGIWIMRSSALIRNNHIIQNITIYIFHCTAFSTAFFFHYTQIRINLLSLLNKTAR